MTLFSSRHGRIAALTLATIILPYVPRTATGQQISACYTKQNGTMYRVGAANTPATCTNPTHTMETWGSKVDQNGVLNLTNANGLIAAGTFGQGSSPATGGGTRMMWYPAKAAFRAGKVDNNTWDPSNTGLGSFAGGGNTTASGNYSTAFGGYAHATGDYAFAAGQMSVASGNTAFALGVNNNATADVAIAIGGGNNAKASGSLAIGTNNWALGDGSVVLGSNGKTWSTATGAFVFSDRSGTWSDPFTNFTANSFLVRAVGGVTFTVANDATCSIPAGGGQWACSSSRLLKTGFADVDGEDVLAKIRTLPVQSWSYKAEGDVRHIGPMSQDFRAAFGLGSDDKTIGVLDAAGVSLAGVKALEARTLQLQAEIAALRSALDELNRRRSRP